MWPVVLAALALFAIPALLHLHQRSQQQKLFRASPPAAAPVDPRARPASFHATGHAAVPLAADVDGQRWEIVLGDFPNEPMYALRIGGAIAARFDDWPKAWAKPSPPPALTGSVAAKADDLVVTYEVGLEHSPTNPWGHAIVSVDATGRARVENRGATFAPRAWEGRLTPDGMRALRETLQTSGFPIQRGGGPSPSGAARGLIVVRAGGAEARVEIDWHRAQKTHGYAELFERLDGIARQLSGGVLERGGARVPPCIEGARSVSLDARGAPAPVVAPVRAASAPGGIPASWRELLAAEHARATRELTQAIAAAPGDPWAASDRVLAQTLVVLGPAAALPLAAHVLALGPALEGVRPGDPQEAMMAIGALHVARIAGVVVPRELDLAESRVLDGLVPLAKRFAERDQTQLAMMAIAIGRPELVPVFTAAPPLPADFVPGQRFELNAWAFTRYLATAIQRGATLPDVTPAWNEHVAVFPMKRAAGSLGYLELTLAARAVHAVVGKQPIATVATSLRALVAS